MKRTAFFTLLLTTMLAFSSTASAEHASEATESSQAAVTRRTSAVPEDYVAEPVEEIITEYRAPEGEQGRGDIKNLHYAYEQSGVPEYISYFAAYDKFLDENNETVILYRVGLTDMSRENREKILSLADDSCYFVFEQATYSYNRRCEIFAELRSEFPDCYVMQGYDEERIILYTSEITEINNALGERYANLVLVCDADGYLYNRDGGRTGELVDVLAMMGGEGGTGGDPLTTIPVEHPPEKSHLPVITAIIAVIIAIAGGGFMLYRKSSVKLNSDGTATAVARLSKADVKRLIEQSTEPPHPELRQRIF